MHMTYWRIFWRTFATLAAAVLVGAQTYDWVNGDKRANVVLIGLGLIVAAIGATGAALWAFAGSPATSPIEKALRSAAQALAAGLAGVAINSVGDLVAMPAALVTLGIGVVLSFFLTYLQNQGAVAPA